MDAYRNRNVARSIHFSFHLRHLLTHIGIRTQLTKQYKHNIFHLAIQWHIQMDSSSSLHTNRMQTRVLKCKNEKFRILLHYNGDNK